MPSRRRWLPAVGQSAMLVAATMLPACGRLGYELLSLPGEGPPSPGSGDAGGVRESGAPPDARRVLPDGSPAASDASPDGPGPAAVVDGHVDAEPRRPDAALSDAATDGGKDAGPRASDATASDAAGFATCPGARVWTLAFDADPTALDSDRDGTLDWVVRGGAAFPVAELSGGVWQSDRSAVLDSRPLEDFASRTLVDVRMQSLSASASGRGAVFWVNLNEGGPLFSALFVSLKLEPGGGQTLALVGKTGTTEVPLASFSNLPEALLDVHLDVDPVALRVTLTVDGAALGSYGIPETGSPNADHFATLLSWDGVSVFDFLRVQRCAP